MKAMLRKRVVVAVAVVLLATTSCAGDEVEIPKWAEGISGPTVLDETGLIAHWEYIGYPDESDAFLLRAGRYTGEFGVDETTPDSTHLIVTWEALPCQQSPLTRVTTTTNKIRIDVYPGPNPNEHCAAMSVRYGLLLQLATPLGTRVVTASLTDPVNSRKRLYEQPGLTG